MKIDLSGKKALVGGSSKGIGLGIARQLAESGASVCLMARDKNKLEEIINELLHSTVSIDGEEKRLAEDDILIVSPYNSQVYELRKKLGEKFRVGTVDKFQGQEAPVVLVSLTASNYEEAPRGIDFILNFNRINVALSRSQCLSIVVGSPELTHLHNQSLNSIRLTNLHRTIMSPN